MNVNLVLFAPLIAEFYERVVCARDPMIPAAQGERAGGIDATDIRRGKSRCRAEGGGLENGAT
jgi:hypothetical protein